MGHFIPPSSTIKNVLYKTNYRTGNLKMISDVFVKDQFKKIEKNFFLSNNLQRISPFNAQLGFGVSGNKWKDQPYEAGCSAHKLHFKTCNTISRFCFDCYKVEIHPQNIMQFLKLFFLFNNLKLKDDNHRKLWLRPRKQIEVNYSGTIYFRSLDDAFEGMDHIKCLIEAEIAKGIPIKVKRGCSEFNQLIPNYFDINYDYESLVPDKKGWEKIENNFKKIYFKNPLPSLIDRCLNYEEYGPLQHNIMFTWLAFAKIIGDKYYQKIINKPWEEMKEAISPEFESYINS